MLEQAGRIVRIARDFGLLGFVSARLSNRARTEARAFGAGVIVGAGIGMLVAPMDGRALRAKMMGAIGVRSWMKKLLAEDEELEARAKPPASDLRASQTLGDDRSEMQQRAPAGAR